LDFKTLSRALSAHGQPDLVLARYRSRPSSITRPKDESRESRCFGISEVPDETIEPRFSAKPRSRTPSPESLFVGRRSLCRLTITLAVELLYQLAGFIQNLESHLARGFVLKVVIDDGSVWRILSDGSPGRTEPSAPRHAIRV